MSLPEKTFQIKHKKKWWFEGLVGFSAYLLELIIEAFQDIVAEIKSWK